MTYLIAHLPSYYSGMSQYPGLPFPNLPAVPAPPGAPAVVPDWSAMMQFPASTQPARSHTNKNNSSARTQRNHIPFLANTAPKSQDAGAKPFAMPFSNFNAKAQPDLQLGDLSPQEHALHAQSRSHHIANHNKRAHGSNAPPSSTSCYISSQRADPTASAATLSSPVIAQMADLAGELPTHILARLPRSCSGAEWEQWLAERRQRYPRRAVTAQHTLGTAEAAPAPAAPEAPRSALVGYESDSDSDGEGAPVELPATRGRWGDALPAAMMPVASARDGDDDGGDAAALEQSVDKEAGGVAVSAGVVGEAKGSSGAGQGGEEGDDGTALAVKGDEQQIAAFAASVFSTTREVTRGTGTLMDDAIVSGMSAGAVVAGTAASTSIHTANGDSNAAMDSSLVAPQVAPAARVAYISYDPRWCRHFMRGKCPRVECRFLHDATARDQWRAQQQRANAHTRNHGTGDGANNQNGADVDGTEDARVKRARYDVSVEVHLRDPLASHIVQHTRHLAYNPFQPVLDQIKKNYSNKKRQANSNNMSLVIPPPCEDIYRRLLSAELAKEEHALLQCLRYMEAKLFRRQ